MPTRFPSRWDLHQQDEQRLLLRVPFRWSHVCQ